MIRSAVVVAVLCAAPAAGPPINKMCPVMTEEEVDPDITVEYQGRTIAFCCDRCVKKFHADQQRYAAAWG